MDKIILENMRFYGYHGVLPEEKKLGQRFFVDAELYLPLQQAGLSDELCGTVNYAEVYDTVRDIVTLEKFSLLEALGERLCGEIFRSQPLVRRIVLRIRKPGAPIDGSFDTVGVQLERDRP